MTLKTFYRKLRRVAREFQWKINRYGNIRGKADGKCFCPITAVYYKETNKYVGVMKEYVISPQLGICYLDEQNIVKAADYKESELDPKSKLTRKALLRAVGLE